MITMINHNYHDKIPLSLISINHDYPIVAFTIEWFHPQTLRRKILNFSHTVDALESLHHPTDGWSPLNHMENNGMFTTYQLVQDLLYIIFPSTVFNGKHGKKPANFMDNLEEIQSNRDIIAIYSDTMGI